MSGGGSFGWDILWDIYCGGGRSFRNVLLALRHLVRDIIGGWVNLGSGGEDLIVRSR